MRWGVVSTVRVSEERLMAFVAHHLSLGAERIWLCFDDPADPAAARMAGTERVEVIRCDDDYWARMGERPPAHQLRQSRNATRCYRRCRLDWLAHIDADEFLWPDPPGTGIGAILASLPGEQIMLRARPFEAMHDPTLPDDIYTARAFRGAIKASEQALSEAVFGPYAPLLPNGMLSHAVGKAFFRTGVPKLNLRLHGAFLLGERLPGPPFDPRVKLLHFHAQDRAAWLDALPFRNSRGAYQFNPALQGFLQSASAEEIAAFYARTQTISPDQAARLRAGGHLVEAELNLRQKVALHFPEVGADGTGGAGGRGNGHIPSPGAR